MKYYTLSLLSIFFVLFFINGSFAQVQYKSNCNCVAFRLDDLQDWYCRKGQQAVMEVFRQKKAPLSIGVIGTYFNDDQENIDFIKQFATDPQLSVEVFNHGWLHENFSELAVPTAKERLNLTNNEIVKRLGIERPYTFAPPMNEFNAGTIQALVELNFTVMTSQIQIDSRPYPLPTAQNPVPANKLWRFPMGASTNDLKQEEFVGIRGQETWKQIQDQMAIDGFSVVMMHPFEFLQKNYSITPPYDAENLNDTMLADLGELIDTVRNAGMKLVLLREIPAAFVEQATTPPTQTNPNTDMGTQTHSNTAPNTDSATSVNTNTNGNTNSDTDTPSSSNTSAGTNQTTAPQDDDEESSSSKMSGAVVTVLLMTLYAML